MGTSLNVKLLLPPRQSRGNFLEGLEPGLPPLAEDFIYVLHVGVEFCRYMRILPFLWKLARLWFIRL